VLNSYELSLTDWGVVAQIVIAIITLSGVLTSIYLSVKALREVQADRKQRQRPHLAFEFGGYRYSIEFKKAGKRIPGMNPKFVERLFHDLPKDADSIRIKRKKNEDGSENPLRIGRLKNYGLGPALGTSVTWIPENIHIGSEVFKIDKNKLSEPLYHSDFNTMPALPSDISLIYGI